MLGLKLIHLSKSCHRKHKWAIALFDHCLTILYFTGSWCHISIMASQITATRLFVQIQQIAQTSYKMNQSSTLLALCVGNSRVNYWFSTQRASNAKKCFHIMTSSCISHAGGHHRRHWAWRPGCVGGTTGDKRVHTFWWRKRSAVSLITPDSKVHGANMGPTWALSAPGGPHVGPINLAVRDVVNFLYNTPQIVLPLIPTSGITLLNY